MSHSRSQPERPLVSVVTVVRNAAAIVQETLESVLEQDYGRLQYLVIDGNSTDDTFSIVRRYGDRIDIAITEPDKGIYDAMNKAARLAAGDFILFMNAGDVFTSASALSDFVAQIRSDADICYSGCIVRYDWGHTRQLAPKSLTHLRQGMVAQHQSMLVRTRLLQERSFDLTIGNGADYAWLIHAYASGAIFMQIQGALSLVSAGGVSDTQRLGTVRSQWRAARQAFPGFATDLHFSMEYLKNVLRGTAKRLLPSSLSRKITSWRI